MIEHEPVELIFPHPDEFKVKHKLKLFNASHEEFVCWHMKNPRHNLFNITPYSGIMYPKTSIELEITLIPNVYYKENSMDVFELSYKTSSSVRELCEKNSAQKQYTKKLIKANFTIIPELESEVDMQKIDGMIIVTPTKTAFQLDRNDDLQRVSVKYGCNPDEKCDIHDLYYESNICQFVKKIDLKEEIQSHICVQCLMEALPKEAMFSGKCSNCCECPVCTSKLTYMQDENECFYFHCNYCKWNSLLIGLRDEKSSGLLQQVRDYELALRSEIEELIGNYKEKLFTIKLEAEQASKTPKELQGTIAPSKRVGHWTIQKVEETLRSQRVKLHYDTATDQRQSIDQILASEDVTAKTYTMNSFQYSQLPTLKQRLERPSSLALFSKNEWPTRMALITKKSKRYNDRLMVKRSKNSFDINANAVKFVPKCSLLNWPFLRYNVPFELYIQLTNPQTENISMFLMQTETADTTAIVECPMKPFIIGENIGLDAYTMEAHSNDQSSIADSEKDWILERKHSSLKLKLRVTPTKPSGDVVFVLKSCIEFHDLKKQHNTSYYMFFSLGSVGHLSDKQIAQQRQQYQQKQQQQFQRILQQQQQQNQEPSNSTEISLNIGSSNNSESPSPTLKVPTPLNKRQSLGQLMKKLVSNSRDN